LAVILWSALSIISLLGALGLVLMFFGRFDFLGWGGEKMPLDKIPSVENTPITPSQRATYNYFLVVALLFLFQTAMGVLTAHYFVEGAGLYGLDIRSILPITITRSWHLQLSIFWIATAWLAAGIFVGPMVAKAEPKGQAALVHILFGAVVLVAVGSIVGEWLGIKGLLGKAWFWLGHQGMGIFGTGTAVADPPHRRHGSLGGDRVPRHSANPKRRRSGRHALFASLFHHRDSGHVFVRDAL
jgi:nitric oxide reductase subunit B